MREDGHSTIVGKTDYPPEQKVVDEHFDAESTFWRDAYQRNDILGILYRQRQAIALNYVDELALPRTARVLEIGCGAGFMAIALARRGFSVEAVDHALAMIELTQRHARQTGLDSRIHAAIEDVHELTFEDQSFDLIVALGVVTWLHDLRKALVEITRVLAHGGYVVLSMDNRYRMQTLLDPLLSPALESIRKRVGHEIERALLERAGLLKRRNVDDALSHLYSIKEFNQYLCEVNLTNIKNTSIGFGPPTILGLVLFSDRNRVKIQQKLQQYADSGCPIIRSIGSQYIVLTRKKSSQTTIDRIDLK
jgi:2-polyprenyl-3-methyl-5-hydroxy-6-metoxy-1,4-benzoquinol methylase